MRQSILLFNLLLGVGLCQGPPGGGPGGGPGFFPSPGTTITLPNGYTIIPGIPPTIIPPQGPERTPRPVYPTTATSAAPAPPGATQSLYGQCGGIGYDGATRCARGSVCYNDGTNPYYSQCVNPADATAAPRPGTTTLVTQPRPTPQPVTVTTVTLTPDDPISTSWPKA